ncbi:MAG: hypothetical protein COX57_02235 [Alphaproteobacteria bacterium CG_4_10_14_0_2_um_filter_63_37]|nr:MAG: hypothetical protein COX57_02235 [Alphaproteobacteria bacterium CG_4_10_14_0_2_um_filter_63_37]
MLRQMPHIVSCPWEKSDRLLEVARGAGLVVCAWGNHGAFMGRSGHVVEMLRSEHLELHALIVNGSGEPGHPLYLAKSRTPQNF